MLVLSIPVFENKLLELISIMSKVQIGRIMIAGVKKRPL
jgi:hypothetical protein